MPRGPSPVLPPRRPTVVLADDHVGMRGALRALVEAGGEVAVAGEAADTDDALVLVARVRPAVLLLDLGLRGSLSSLEAIGRIRVVSPGTGVVVVTMHDDPALVRAALRAGAAGYVLKERAGEMLACAVRDAAGRQSDDRAETSTNPCSRA